MDKVWQHKLIGEAQEGRPVIWLHGWGQDHQSLVKIAENLSHKGPHYLFDQPGFGGTPMLPKGYGTGDYADRLREQLEALNIQGPVVLVGHSFGARVSVQLAHLHPEWVAGIVMIGGAGLKRKRSPLWFLNSWRLKLMGKLAFWSDKLFGTEKLAAFRAAYGSADYKNAGELRETFVKVVNEDLSQKAKTLRCPALMIYGSDDRETPPEMGQRYAKLINQGHYVECAGLGHLDILDRGAYQVKAYVDDFLGRL